jgi:hypothetical protein
MANQSLGIEDSHRSLSGIEGIGAGSVSPAGPNPDVGNADMILDLDMQSPGFVVNLSNQITFIPDQSQYANNASQTEFFGPTPLWATLSDTGINGFAACRVANNETKGIGLNGISVPNWLVSNSNYTSIGVYQSKGPNGPLGFIPGFDGIVFPRIHFGAYTTGGVQDFIPSFTGGFTAIPYTDGIVDYTNVPIVFAVRCVSDVVTVFVNGFKRTIGPLIGNTAVAFRSYVMGLAGGDGTETDVGEQRFYKVGYTDDEVQNRIGYLAAKWRVPLVQVLPPRLVQGYSFAANLATAAVAAMSIPVVAGKRFFPTSTLRFALDSLTGTATTNGAYSILKDGVAIPAFTTVAINGATIASFASSLPASINEGNNLPVFDTVNHVYTIQITTPVGGISAGPGRWVIDGYFE